MKTRTSITMFAVTLLLLTASSFIASASSASLEGKFVQYKFDTSLNEDGKTRSVSGSLKQEVVADYGNGTSRVKFSGNIGATSFSVERNVPTDQVKFPNISALPTGSFSYGNTHINVTVSLKKTGDESVTFNGTRHDVSVHDYNLTAHSINTTRTFILTSEGDLKTFQSGLVHSLNGKSNLNADNRTVTSDFAVQITATNLDLEANSATSSALSPSTLIASFVGLQPTGDKPTGNNDLSTTAYIPVITAAGAGVLGAALYVRKRRQNGRNNGSENKEKPPHWVY